MGIITSIRTIEILTISKTETSITMGITIINNKAIKTSIINKIMVISTRTTTTEI